MDAARRHTDPALQPRHRVPDALAETTPAQAAVAEAPVSKVQAFLRAHGHDWDVVGKPLYQRPVDGVTPAGLGIDRQDAANNAGDPYQQVEGYQGIYRRDSLPDGSQRFGKQPLAVVSTQYTPVSNRDAFAVLDPLVENHQVKLTQAGTHHDGRGVYIAGEIARAPLPGSTDEVAASLFMETSHDGFGGIKPSLNIQLPKTSGGLRIPFQSGYSTHRGKVDERLKQANEVYQKASLVLQSTMTHVGAMAVERIPRNQMRQVIAKTFEAPEDPLEWTAQTMNRQTRVAELALAFSDTENANRIAALTSDGDAEGNDPTVGPTKLQVLRAVITYTNDEMRSRGGADGRKVSALVGYGHECKLRAFNLLAHGEEAKS
jgi:hypothetical protein